MPRSRPLLVALALAACADARTLPATAPDAGAHESPDGGSSTAIPDAGPPLDTPDAGPAAPDAGSPPLLGPVSETTWVGPFGADRPVRARVPAGYDPAHPAPLVVLLHGYSAWGWAQDFYLQLSALGDEKGFVYVAPDGLRDPALERYWNATDACCDLFDRGNDDVAYLTGLLDEIQSVIAIDPKRVYFVGHSNGAFMSQRMACEISPRVAAVASLAGAQSDDPGACHASAPVSVLEIHGTLDAVILYGGGSLPHSDGRLHAYPGAERTALTWARKNRCSEYTRSGDDMNLDFVIPFDETRVESYLGCPAGIDVTLWTMRASGHVPVPVSDFSRKIWDFLAAHPRP